MESDFLWQWCSLNGLRARRDPDSLAAPRTEENAMGVLDDYMVSPNVSFLDKTRIQAQALVPVLRALREELGRDKAHALVRRALRDWSRDLFTEIGASIEAASGANGRRCKAPITQ